MPELPESVFADSEATEDASPTDEIANVSEETDRGKDTEGAQFRRFWGRPQQADLPLVNTIGEALGHVTDIFDKQIATAIELGAQNNEAIPGDAAARGVFYTLLPESYQRRIFLATASNSRAWPRLRPLFGAPPYAFLGPQDAGMLRATGIAVTRQNMAYDGNMIANYSQFGAGQLIDDSEREYRVVDTTAGEQDPLPCNLEGRAEFVQLIVRVHKRSREEKVRRLKDVRLRKTITFPMPGEKLYLTETKRLQAIQGKRPEAATRATLQVRQVKPRGANAATASILAVWG